MEGVMNSIGRSETETNKLEFNLRLVMPFNFLTRKVHNYGV